MATTRTGTAHDARARSTSPSTRELALLRERVALTRRASEALRAHAWRALMLSDDLQAAGQARRARGRRSPAWPRDAVAQLLVVLDRVARADTPLVEDAIRARLAQGLAAGDLRAFLESLRALQLDLTGHVPRFRPVLRNG